MDLKPTKNVHSCQNSLFLRNAMTFEVGVAETPLHWAPFLRPLDADLIN